jgi:hypothetical protein
MNVMEQPVSDLETKVKKTVEEIISQIKKYGYSLFENQQVVDEIVKDTRGLEDIGQQQIIVTELLSLAGKISEADSLNARKYDGRTPENVIYANRIKANTVCMPAVLNIIFPNPLAKASSLHKVLQKHLASTTFNVGGGLKNTMISDFMKTRGIIEYNAMTEFNKLIVHQFDILRDREAKASFQRAEQSLDGAREIIAGVIKEEEASLNNESGEKLASNDEEKMAQIEELFRQNKDENLGIFDNQEAINEVVKITRTLNDIKNQDKVVDKLLKLSEIIFDETIQAARAFKAGTLYWEMYANSIKAHKIVVDTVLKIIFPNTVAKARELYKVLSDHINKTALRSSVGRSDMIVDYMVPFGTRDRDYQTLADSAMKNFYDSICRRFNSMNADEEKAIKAAEAMVEKAGEELRKTEAIISLEKGQVEKELLGDDQGDVINNETTEIEESSGQQTEAVSNGAVEEDLNTIKGMIELGLVSPDQLKELSAVLNKIKEANEASLEAPKEEQASSLTV